jgi:hypothetical protein
MDGQNYFYLIKKPEDQYQVILEVEDSARSKPEDLSLLGSTADRGGQERPPLQAINRERCYEFTLS